MWENSIGWHIRKCNRRILVVNSVVLAALVLGTAYNQRYLYNCFKGPLPTSPDALVKAANPAGGQRYFVSFDQVKAVKAGLQRTETSNGTTRVAETYFAVRTGSKFLVIQSPDSTASASYDGALVPVSDDLREQLQKKLDSRNLKYDDIFLPYMLDADSFRSGGYVGLALGIPLALLALYNIVKAVRRMNDMETSPVARSLRRFSQPPANVAMLIDQDLKSSPEAVPGSALMLGASWMLHPTFFGIDVLHRDEIMWVYEKVTTHRVNFVPTGKTYALVIGDERGRRIEVPAGGRGKRNGKEKLDVLLREVINRFPWVIAGYSDQRKNEYEKNRAAFVAFVRERQTQYLRAA